jgi:hypothetical protein
MSHLNSSLMGNKTEAVIKSLPKNKSSGSGGFISEYYQNYKEELVTMLLRLFYKIEREGMLQNSFYQASITMTPKLVRNPPNKQNHKPISLMLIDKYSQ